MSLNKNSTGISLLSKDKSKGNTKEDYVVALAGNPNVGKSTVFNALTGLNQHTGNWPGKTVAKAEGYYEFKDSTIKIVDLPGTYSLLSNSEEEEIARDYICFNDPDIVVVVADATSLERNLNLFIQISEITEKAILCVNLTDEAEKNNIKIDLDLLSKELNANLVSSSARNGVGIEELKEAIFKEITLKVSKKNAINYDSPIEKAIEEIEIILDETLEVPKRKKRWIALRILEGNTSILKSLYNKYNIQEKYINMISKIKDELNKNYKDELVEDIIIKSIIKEAERIGNKVVKGGEEYTDFQRKIDKILVSKSTGIPIMIMTLLVVLWITITLANYPSEMLANMFAHGEIYIRDFFSGLNLPSWISGILIDGIYVTLAWVISVMLPPMAIFFPMFTLLEDLGYLPRIAFNLDKCFKKCCACGKQALTMCMGLGCNAAGIIGCRIINSPRERIIAILTNAFMPCNGRFPMLISIAAIFIGGISVGIKESFISALTVTVVIILGVLMTLLVSKILSKTILKGMPSNFILELPPYRKPQVGKVIVRSIFDRTLYVLGRAIAIAAPAGAVIWIFSNIMIGDSSILTICANYLSPLANAIGVDGYILMAFILGLPANEIVMPIIIMSYLRATTMLELDNLYELKELLVANGWTILTAINVMILCLMHYPCGTTLWTIKQETKSFKWTALSFLIPTVAGIVICFITTQLWRLFA
ncbi:TPA: ferrous iron transport protein B [Clostridium perfringens]|uniref:ferrous iron transport protein B n=1 Tax=Clostridium perfringens TaxID=1502 RepID=UPI0018AC280F|nr:ferrous iron transport protein B [Clostridium perfringens]EHR1328751.1 ferrous iron transport protein B [Clostridium perfringens]EHR1331884.1 ferrous iron transport protein B [Clostridium perfringens]EHR1425361.1 ferrous iron transport protein B [Clostridium perfringens]EIF6165278.1 ferrous iron transport protein B [Clostridium perfringens]MDU0867050.1 ferrous iron transport protein B [Clostridium perfringens]